MATALKFEGLNEQILARAELRHISRTEFSYQVRIERGGKRVFDRSVVGHSEESLSEAKRLRDEALRQWPPRVVRTNAIPAQVLAALGLTKPVPGICRLPSRSVYRVHCYNRSGRSHYEQFYYRVVPEEVAYAAAIAFVQNRPLTK